ncbi:MAG: transglycosylase SLT domain-containing protein [Alphaproteobacteria bacterium]|jgi:soluble lytic murein transglycosylase-like protein|nr:transglycosylase SLT domain-containing protein [Alphaproteobacteria bacterium]
MSPVPAVHSIGGYQISDRVLGAVREASQRTGTDFAYMMAKAATESAFQPDARAATSNATGLFQFIDSTWISMVHRYGERYGLGAQAARITPGPGGALSIADPADRRAILDLRRDPRLSALMAGEYANENRAHLEQALRSRIGPTELYMAHFLGAHGGARFLETLRQAPDTLGAQLFPAAAAANRPAFYERGSGRPLTVREIYGAFERRVQRTMAMVGDIPGGPPPQAAPTAASPPPTVAAPRETGNEVPGGRGYFAARPAPASFFTAAARTTAPEQGWTRPAAVNEPADPVRPHPRAAAHPASAAGPGEPAGGDGSAPPPGGRQLSLWAVLTASS